jgi:hypothetical protein
MNQERRTEAAHRLLHVVRGDERVGRPRGGRGASGNVCASVGVPLQLRHRRGTLRGRGPAIGSGGAPRTARRRRGGESESGGEAETAGAQCGVRGGGRRCGGREDVWRRRGGDADGGHGGGEDGWESGTGRSRAREIREEGMEINDFNFFPFSYFASYLIFKVTCNK